MYLAQRTGGTMTKVYTVIRLQAKKTLQKTAMRCLGTVGNTVV